MSGEVTIIARGNLLPADLEACLRFLGDMGLSAEVVDGQQSYDPQAPSPMVESVVESDIIVASIYPLDAINERDQFLGAEHVDQYRDRFMRDLSQHVVAGAFGMLVTPKLRGSDPSADIYGGMVTDPATLGLKVCERSAVGLPDLVRVPGSFTNNPMVVEVGSFLTFANAVAQGENFGLWHFSAAKKDFLVRLKNYLEPRVESVAQTDSRGIPLFTESETLPIAFR